MKFGLDEVKKQMNFAKVSEELNLKNLPNLSESKIHIEDFKIENEKIKGVSLNDLNHEILRKIDKKTLNSIESKLDEIVYVNTAAEKEKSRPELSLDL